MLGWGLGVALQGVNAYSSVQEAKEDGLDLDSFNEKRDAKRPPTAEPVRREGRYSEDDFV